MASTVDEAKEKHLTHTLSMVSHPLKRTSIHWDGRFLTIFLLPGVEDPLCVAIDWESPPLEQVEVNLL